MPEAMPKAMSEAILDETGLLKRYQFGDRYPIGAIPGLSVAQGQKTDNKSYVETTSVEKTIDTVVDLEF